MFAKRRGYTPKHPRQERHRKSWISPETWSLIGTRTAACRQGDQRNARDLVRAIRTALQGYRHRQAAEAVSAVEYLLTSDTLLIREAWIRIRGWYTVIVDRPPPPARVALTTMTAEREELYRHVPSLGEPIPMGDPPFPFLVDHLITDDEELAWAVDRLHLNCSGGPSGMRAEHLRQWLIAEMRDDSPDATNWLKVVAIVQAAF